MTQVSSTRKLVSASALMASGTMISRILGVVRVVLISFILGNGTRQADMLGLATMVPNSLYILFAGGALNTVLVPQIVRAIKNDADGGEAYTNRIMTAFMLIVSAVAVVVTLGAPIVTMIYTSDAWRAPELADQYASMVALTYLTLPQIFFYGAFFLLGQILNARDRFGPMMWAPIANNVISILVLAIYLVVWGNQNDHSAAFSTPQLMLLGIGSTVGIAAQTAVLLPYVRRVGFRLRPRFDLKGTGLGKTFSLTKWTIGFVAVNQLALMIVNRLATSATAGGHGAGVNVYANAHLVWILPHSLITVSLATAMLPNASRLAAAADLRGVAAEFTKTVRLALVAIVPASVAFVSLAGPISGILFGHGTGAADAGWVAWALIAFAIGLVPFTVQFVCLRTFYAMEDTRTPFFLQLVIAGINMVGALLLVWWVNSPSWVAAALALSYSLAYLFGVLVSWQQLKRRVPALDGGKMVLHLVRLLLGSALGGAAAYYASLWLVGVIPSPFLGNVVSLGVGGLLILGFFLVVGKLLKVRELTSLSQLVRTRLGRRKADSSDAEMLRESAFDSAAAATSELVGDQTPTIIQPAVGVPPRRAFDDEDSGPATIVRNRPPVVEHTFDAPQDEENESPEHASSEQESPEHESPDAESPGDADDVSWDDQATGPIDLEGLFREEDDAEDTVRIATVGVLLNTRYELLELLARRHGTETWRAHDQVLSRDVVVHVIAPGDPRISELLMAARKGAVATDSRFLRVLDADEVTDPGQGIGAYVVAEYAPGRSLTQLLTKGPLSAIEAAFITRELADALIGVHAQGLFHEQLNPDNVIITTSGAVRLVGFGIEATLAGSEADAWSMRERSDVEGLGMLLYAMLVRHWPGESRWGLPAAPLEAGEPAPPHAVQVGISPALDGICTSTLAAGPGERRISSASQLVAALTQVLGTADASADLEQRVRSWPSEADAPVTRTVVSPLTGTAPLTLPEAARPAHSPVSPSDPEEGRRPRRVLWVLVVLAVLTLVVSLIIVGINNARDNAAEPGAVTTSGAPSATEGEAASIAIAAVSDFDPETDGGNGEELPEQVGNVIDGNPETSWQTMRYLRRPDLGGLKPGVGLVLDLGEPKTVTGATLTLTGGATSVELRVPKGAEPSTRTEADWEVVGANAEATGTTTITLDEPTDTRYLLVYFTNLPEVEGGYRAEVNEVTLH